MLRRQINHRLPRNFLPLVCITPTTATSSLRFNATNNNNNNNVTLGGSFEKAGYSSNLKTPSFGDIGNMPSPPDLGDISTQPATNLDIKRDLQGPWIFLASPNLEGELFVREDGTVLFRPGNSLGWGIGKMKLSHTVTGTAVAEIELETYLYETTSREPPLHPSRTNFVVSFSVASAPSQGYKTFTMNGQAMEVEQKNMAQENKKKTEVKNVRAVNAAKLEPWDPKAQANEWLPDPQIEQGFKVLFPRPFTLSRLDPKQKPVDLPKHKVGSINTVYYIPDYVSDEEQTECLIQNRDTPAELKNPLDRRVVQEYGGTMCGECQKSFVSDANIPPWTNRICDALVKDRVFAATTFPNNVRIHDYEVGHGIAPHCDGPIYVPRVAILSLGSPVLMSFYAKRKPYDDVMQHYNDTFKHEGDIVKEKPVFSLVLEPKSLLVFEDDAYWFHPHGISANEYDSLDEEKVGPIANRHLLRQISKEDLDVNKKFKREHRVGVTLRNLLPRCNHEPMRGEYQMMKAQNVLDSQRDLSGQNNNNLTQISSLAAGEEVKSPKTSLYSQMSKSIPLRQNKQHQPVENTNNSNNNNNNNNKTVSSNTNNIGNLENKIDLLLERQIKLEGQLREIQTLLAFNTQRNVKFETDVAAVLDHVSSVVLDVQAKVDDIADDVNKQ